MKTLIRQARLISPDVDLPCGDLLLENGLIRDVSPAASAPAEADRVIEAAGMLAMPGFIDIHAHGADGHDVNDATAEAIRHIARRKLQEGVTTWLPTTLTLPQDSLAAVMAVCAEYRQTQEFCKVPGVHIEGPFLNPDKVGAQNPQFLRPPDLEELRRLHAIAPALILSIAPELPGAGEVIAGATALGITSSAAHTNAGYAEIAQAKPAGLRHLTHFASAMTPLHHRAIGAVGAGLLDDDLLLEIICDTIHLSPDMLRLLFKLVPIERLMMITDSMAASWIGAGEVRLGGLEVLVEDGKATLKHGGALAGSALRYQEGVRHVAELTGLPLSQLVKATSWNQARSLGLERLGKLEPGFCADIVLLREDFSVWKTFVNGEER